MYGNVELLAMIFIDSKMVLVSRGHIISIDIQSIRTTPTLQYEYAEWTYHLWGSSSLLQDLLHWIESFVRVNKKPRVDDTNQQTLQM